MKEFYDKYNIEEEKRRQINLDANEVRNKFLKLALKERLGSLYLQNNENFYPHQIEHVQPFPDEMTDPELKD